jgi:hypothetical protein
MATILQFPAADAKRKRALPSGGESAQIVFFTGVRYERFDEMKPQPRRKTKPQTIQAELQVAL